MNYITIGGPIYYGDDESNRGGNFLSIDSCQYRNNIWHLSTCYEKSLYALNNRSSILNLYNFFLHNTTYIH